MEMRPPRLGTTTQQISNVGCNDSTVVTLPIQFVGFWAAVSLPFFYLPHLVNGLHGTCVLVFTCLLVLHVVALVLGRGHRRDE